MSKIGVFDSGIGGLSVAKAVEKAFPDDIVIYVSDTKHVPYGDKPLKTVFELVVPILEGLVNQGCDVIVIACNTVTTNHIVALRERFSIPLVGIEPMVKPAATKTKSGVIAVCATPATLASKRYAWLKQTYAAHITVLEPDCSQWANMIEHNKLNAETLRHQIDELCNAGADVIVLGCTHYHWIADLIQQIASERAIVVQPEQPVIAQIRRVLKHTD